MEVYVRGIVSTRPQVLTQNLLQQSRCAARAASAVCTPVLPPNASSSLDEASGGSANTHTQGCDERCCSTRRCKWDQRVGRR